MKIQKQPDYLIFANSAKVGEISDFPDVSRGWGVTIEQTGGKPPLEWMNSAFNRIDAHMMYLIQQGVPEWNEKVKYPANAIIKYNGVLYTATAENDHSNPASTSKWKKTIPETLKASLTQTGIVKLNSSANSMSETEAATPRAVKTAYDVAAGSVKKRGDEMTGHLRMLNSSGIKFGYENGGELAVRVINNDLEFIFYDSQTKRWITKLRHSSNDNSWRFENINDVKVNNASVANTLEHFQPLPFESVMFSPSKQYHATVRDDGVFGFFDKASQNQNLCWAVDKFGDLVHGHVHVNKISGLEQFIFDCFPAGIPLPWSQVTPPDGWFECNGSQFDVNQFPRLASVYPTGRLPDLRGEFIRGWDNTRRVDTDRVILSHQDHQIQRHSHGQNIKVYAEQGTGNPWGSGGDKFESDYWFNTGEAGGNETRPRNVAFMYIVKAE